MNMITKLATTSMLLAGLSGCAMVAAPVSNGALFTNVRGPGHATTAVEAKKQGTGCSSNILGLIATGDSSIDSAKNSANIKEVSSVDYDSLSVLGIYARFCVVVRGN